MVVQQTNVLLVSDANAVKQVVDVGLGEEGAVLELSQVRGDIVVLLNSFHDVALAFQLEEFLSHHRVAVVQGHANVIDIAVLLFEVSRVSECALVVRHGPGRRSHHTEVVVAVSVHASHEGVLGGEVGTVH